VPLLVKPSQCATGFYSGGGTAADCASCPISMTTEAAGAETDAACDVCYEGYGYNADTKACELCAAGLFAAGGALDACSACPTGASTASTGASVAQQSNGEQPCVCESELV
jgi:hypothetical protein